MALKEDKSKSALAAMTAKLEAEGLENMAQEGIGSWVMVQCSPSPMGGGRWGGDVTPSFLLCLQDDSEQSNVTAGIQRQGLSTCSDLLFSPLSLFF